MLIKFSLYTCRICPCEQGVGIIGVTGLPALQPLPCLLRSCVGGERCRGQVYQYTWPIGFPVPLSYRSFVAFKPLRGCMLVLEIVFVGKCEVFVWLDFVHFFFSLGREAHRSAAIKKC